MKIHGDRPDGIAQTGHTASERVRTGRSEPGTPSDASSGDSVRVSEDARLLNEAMKAASAASESTDARVERARQKLEAGELGQDAERLADKLIDYLLR
jgi:flagellar biosynthesis anti-sigma factor FlgM